MTAVSVSANEEDEPGILDRVDIDIDAFAVNEIDDSTTTDEEPNLIAPNPDADEEPLIIAPGDSMENDDALSGDNGFTTGLIIAIGISGVASLATALIIFKKKN